MYGDNDRPKEDDLPKRLNAVVFAIAASTAPTIKDKGYGASVMEAIRRLAAADSRIEHLESQLEMANATRRNRGLEMGMMPDMNQPQKIELPHNARSVEIKF